jgi:hypothetical protein
MKFKATLEIVYDVNPDHYVDDNGDHQDVEKMLAIDRENIESEPHAFLDFGEVKTTLEEYNPDSDYVKNPTKETK